MRKKRLPGNQYYLLLNIIIRGGGVLFKIPLILICRADGVSYAGTPLGRSFSATAELHLHYSAWRSINKDKLANDYAAETPTQRISTSTPLILQT